MLRVTSGIAALVASITLAGACASERVEKSTGTNWIRCNTDDDCLDVSGARCGAASVCVDVTGKPIAAPERGSGGAGTGGGGGSPESGGATGGGGAAAAGGGAEFGSGGVESGSGGSAAAGSSGSSGADGGPIGTPACYSPAQNYERAYDEGMVGCECPGWAEAGICIGRAALICTDGRWNAVEDGPCMGCWTPDDPTNAVNRPTAGCPCADDFGPACMHTIGNGYMRGRCTGGRWQLLMAAEPCSCTSDTQCGFGSRCEDGKCLEGRCEVDGVFYAEGVTGIPDPESCNLCVCGADGLECDDADCPEP